MAADTDVMGETTGHVAHPRRRRWIGVALVAAIGAVGLTGSWAASAAVERSQQRHAGQLMNQYADEVSRAVTAEADRYRDTLSDVTAAVGAQSDLSNADFVEITSTLSRQRLPGAAGTALVVPADDTDLTGIQAYWRAHGASGLTLASAGPADEHMFVVFTRALDGSATTAGRDLSRTSEPSDALKMSRATGQVTASVTYVLFKDRELPAAEQQKSAREPSSSASAPLRGCLTPFDAGWRGAAPGRGVVSESFRFEPGECDLGDVLPAVVDCQEVTAALEDV
jgi:hypothetical protein